MTSVTANEVDRLREEAAVAEAASRTRPDDTTLAARATAARELYERARFVWLHQGGNGLRPASSQRRRAECPASATVGPLLLVR